MEGLTDDQWRMIRVENLIVEGEYFVPTPPESKKDETIEALDDIRRIIDRYMTLKGFITDKLEPYNQILRRTRDEFPWKVIFRISFGKIGQNPGFNIFVRSEPAVYFKMTQLDYKPLGDDFWMSKIEDKGRDFIKGVMGSFVSREVKEPKTVSRFIKTPILTRLKSLNFSKSAELLRSGRQKVEAGKTEDGLTDLRSSLEAFLKECVKKQGKQEKRKIKENLKILSECEVIGNNSFKLMNDVLCNWLYRILSEEPVHERVKLNLYEARCMFNIAEDAISYIIDRMIFVGFKIGKD